MSPYDYDLIIRNGRIVTESKVIRGDIAVQGEKIVEIVSKFHPSVSAKVELDATGLHVLPGLIDTHVHLNEPGRTEWEGFASGTRSLAAGGVTTFFDMPLNSNPPTTTIRGLSLKREAAEKHSMLDYGLFGGLVPGNLDSLESLKEAGVVGFKAFMSSSGMNEFPHVDDHTLFHGMKKIANLGSILALHAESDVITEGLAAFATKQGHRLVRDYCASRPILSEVEAVGRAMAFAEATGCKLHIVHVTSGEVIKHINLAKRKGVDVTVETCPHYLSLNVEDFERLGGLAKCAPPLRDQEHIESLWDALASGEIDIIGSDHSPVPPDLKKDSNGDIFSVWGGISGAQSTLHVMLEEGFWRRKIPLETISRVTSTNPAKRFGLYPRKGVIAVGSDADLTVVDLHKSFTLKTEDLYYRHPQSPYVGKTFRGTILFTFLRGRSVFEKGVITSGT